MSPVTASLPSRYVVVRSWFPRSFLFPLLAFPLLTAPARAAESSVTLAAQSDKSILITAKTYSAQIDPEGNLRSLQINGTEFLDAAAPNHGGAFPGGPATSVNVRGQLVAARRDPVRVEYSFDDTGLSVLTEGGTLEYRLSPNVIAAVAKNGTTTNLPKGASGDNVRIIARKADSLVAFSLNQPFHVVHDKLFPSYLTRGGKPETLFQYRIECGVSATALDLVSIESLSGPDHNPFIVPQFAQGQPAQIDVDLRSAATAPVKLDVHYTIKDHWVKGRTVAEKTIPAEIPPGKPALIRCEASLPAPGMYWIYVELLAGKEVLKRQDLGLVYDAPHYLPPLTRPQDFSEFWTTKLKALRALPMADTLTENQAKSTPATFHYDLQLTTLTGHGPRQIKTSLRVPRTPGQYPGYVDTYWESAGAPKTPGEDNTIRVGFPLPDDSTFTRWVSRDDNNMLDSYLLAVRMNDYLRARSDVTGIFLSGGSRSGPIVLVAAALDPAKIAAVIAHVPTSAGLSWTDKPYSGWGNLPGGMTPEKAHELVAYFDPVNFAPDIKTPFMVNAGSYDNLAPAPGVLALFNHAVNAPWKRCAIERGGHGYFSPKNWDTFHKELDVYLKQKTQTNTDESILKLH